MRIFGASQVVTSTAWSQRAARVPENSTRTATRRAELAQRHIALNRSRRNLEKLVDELEPLRNKSIGRRGARAVGEADLSVEASASTLTSTEEINTTSTSYEPHHPEWDGPQSTAPIEVTGTYDGRYGETQLEFRVRRSRTVGGSKTLQLDIYVGGTRKDRLSWSSGSSGPKTSKSGLVVDLGDPGTYVRRNESFFVDVSDVQGTDARVDEAMNTLEAELETPVVDGSFLLEGQAIDVYATDSIQDVMDRINSAGVGITASLAGDMFTLTRDEVGADDISIGGDTSGFLEAMKLSGASVVLGVDDDVEARVIEEVDALSSVTSGSFTLNGESFAVDVSADSLSDVLGAINDSGVATATLDSTTGRLRLKAAGGGSLKIQDDTGLFEAFDISNGTYKARKGGGLPRSARQKVALALQSFVEDMNSLLSEHSDGLGGVRTAIGRHFDDSDLDSGWGLVMDLEGDGDLDDKALDKMLMSDPDEVFDLLIGAERGPAHGRVGLIEDLIEKMKAREKELGGQHGYSGLLLDIAA